MTSDRGGSVAVKALFLTVIGVCAESWWVVSVRYGVTCAASSPRSEKVAAWRLWAVFRTMTAIDPLLLRNALTSRPAGTRCRADADRARADEAAVARERRQPTGRGDRVALDVNQSRVGAGDGRRARVRAPQVEERAQVRFGQARVDVLCPSEPGQL